MKKRFLFCKIALAEILFAQVFPRHTVEIKLDFTPRTSWAEWDSGYLPTYTRSIEGVNGPKPTAWLLDRNGATVIPETEVSFPDARLNEIKAVTADTSGNLYASIEAWSNDGRGIGAICKIERGGKTALVIRTDEFVATSLAATKAGEIWAFGLPLLLQAAKRTTEEYFTLWRFDSDGHVVDKLLPRSTFGTDIIPTHAFGNIGSPRVWATSTHVGVYSSNAHRWVEYEISSGRKIFDAFLTPPTPADNRSVTMGELVMTDTDNAVYAYFGYAMPDATHPNALYWLDKSAQRWVRANEHNKSSEYRMLQGADGDNLIFRAGSSTFGWFSSAVLQPTE